MLLKRRFLFALAMSCILEAQCADKYTDENRPYEFGFKIDGEQHRHEKKDENGLIMGEFGFITADGVYHVTVYATDENGNFKILSMKNIRVKPYPTGPQREGHSLALPPAQTGPHSQTTSSTEKPIPKVARPGPAAPALSCSHCSIPTTTTRKPLLTDIAVVSHDKPSEQLIPSGVSNAQYPQNNLESNGGVTRSSSSQSNYPQSGTVIPAPRPGANVPSEAGRDYQKSGPSSNYPQSGSGGNYGSNPNYPGSSDNVNYPGPGGNYAPSETGANNPSSGSLPSSPQSGLNENYPQSVSNANYPHSELGSNYPQSRPDSNYPQSGSGSNYPPSGPDVNHPQTGSDDTLRNTQGSSYPPQGPYGNDNSQKPGGQQSLPANNERNPKQYTGSAFNQGGLENGNQLGQSGAQAPNKPTLISAQMQIVDKNTDIYKKNPGERDGLPDGLNKRDMLQLLYTFNYTVGFHGHHEEGYTNGAKQGYYYITGRNGVRTRVDYVADENGFRPKITQEVLDVLSDEVPKPETEKDEKYGLKGYEFKWLYYPTETKTR